MDNLPYEIFTKIMLHVSYTDYDNVLSIYKKHSKISTDNYYWYKNYVNNFAKEGYFCKTTIKKIIPYNTKDDFKGYYYMRGYHC